MKILLTNDDGVRADGMGVMRRIAAELSDDVWVCASEQSAASRGVSLHNPVSLRKLDDRVYAVTGTPTDSIIVAMRDLFKDSPPDLILSGVNRGQNLAEDITIALSLARGFQGASSLPWDTAEAHAPNVIRKLLKAGWPSNVVPNVNFPDVPIEDVKGIEITRQGHRDFQMSGVDKRQHPRGGHYFWLTYGAKKSNPPAGTDLRAIYDGYISVTPLHTDLTHFEALDSLSHKMAD